MEELNQKLDAEKEAMQKLKFAHLEHICGARNDRLLRVFFPVGADQRLEEALHRFIP